MAEHADLTDKGVQSFGQHCWGPTKTKQTD